MPGNTIGHLFCLTTFGESHGQAVGGVIDGCPANVSIDFDFIQQELNRRKPAFKGSTARKEPDIIEFLSGIFEGKTLGTPIAFQVKNTAFQESDYLGISNIFRPSHADYTFAMKYGDNLVSGGGRASGRETVARVAGGAVAKLYLRTHGIEISAFVSQIGDIMRIDQISEEGLSFARRSSLGCPDPGMEQRVSTLIDETGHKGDTIGGTVTCLIRGVPVGLGEPVFNKLHSDLAKAELSIGSAKAFEYGLGFRAASMKGSEYNDQMTTKNGRIIFLTNHDGGIQGGISNGQDIYFRVGFKPVPSVKLPQSTVSRTGEAVLIKIGGRHDTCHVPRLVVVVESMAALVLADHLLLNKSGLA
jgi:chorismate synthase